MKINNISAVCIFLVTVCLSSFCQADAQVVRRNPPQTVNGWLVHWPDPAYLNRVLEAAPGYKINHLELSHDIIMQVDEATEDPKRGELIQSVAKRARAKGIKSYIWAHEINTRDKNAPLDPDVPEGKAFWEKRREAYRRTLRACPSVAGVVLMFGSSPYEVWDRPSTPGDGDGWQRRTAAQRVRFITDLVCAVVRDEFHKEVFVRDFNHGPSQLESIREALKDYPGITIISKAEPQDFQPFYPHSFTLGAFGATPQIVEIDLCGEYWGQSLILTSLAGYVPYRLKYDQEQGTIGAVGRVDCFSNSALGTPSEINFYAFQRVLEDRNVTADAIYAEWMKKRYGLKPGGYAARQMTEIFERSWQMAKKLYYTQGFWIWKNLSSIPERSASIDGGIAGKSNALWDSAQKPLEQRLLHPDAALVRAIREEKAEAVKLAQSNLTTLAGIRSSLAPADYADIERRLRLAVDLANIYQAIADAYWRVKLSENAPGDAEASIEKVNVALSTLTPMATLLEKNAANFPWIGKQSQRLINLQTDLTARYGRIAR